VSFLEQHCVLRLLTQDLIEQCEEFVCEKDKEINNFFHNEYSGYAEQLLGKSYCFVDERASNKIVCAFTVANAAINISSIPNSKRNKLNRKIPHSKQRSQYPAVLIGQLAVFNGYNHCNIGDELMDFIKAWFISSENKTGCRYLIVDATNTPKVIQYYIDNGFDLIFSSDEEELKYLGNKLHCDCWINKLKSKFCRVTSSSIKTRLMIFDLIPLRATRKSE